MPFPRQRRSSPSCSPARRRPPSSGPWPALPEEIHAAARDYDPSRINRYLVELAGEFHRFYSACRIKGETPALLAARLKLADSVRSVLANCLGLLGVTAPEKM